MAEKINGEKKRQNQELAGIPDSKIFATGEGNAEQEALMAKCHVGGVPVTDLPLEIQRRLVYRQTDEGIAEYNEGKSELRISTITDEFTKQCARKRDDIVDRGMEPWEASDPMKSLTAEFVRPGFRGKFLSQAKVDKDGMRGYVPCRDEAGQPVKLRNMVLAEMPIERVDARNKFYREKAQQAVTQVKTQYMREGGKTAVDPKD